MEEMFSINRNDYVFEDYDVSTFSKKFKGEVNKIVNTRFGGDDFVHYMQNFFTKTLDYMHNNREIV